MKIFFFVLALLANIASAQYITNVGMIDGATGNLVYTTTNPPPPGADPFTWSGFISTTSTGGGYNGGYAPGYNSNTGTFMFGYNQGTIAYSTPVNYALSMAGTGIQVNGFKYSWEYYNQGDYKGTLSSNINLTSSAGQTLQSYDYYMPYTLNGWTRMSGTENFNTQYTASSLGNLNVSFTGKDDKWWAGYYGPQVRDISVNLLYSVIPTPIPTDFSKWITLTGENGEFTLTKAGVVRYGADGTYVYQSFEAGTYSCSNSAWGKDPIGGVYKSCSLGTNTTTTTPTLPKTTTTDSTLPLLEPVTTTTSSTTTPTTVTIDPVTTTTSPTTIIGLVTTTPAIASAPSSVSTSNSTTSTSQSSTKESNQSSGGNVNLALSIINKNSERDATGSAVAQSAMAQAQSAAVQAQQEANNVASNAVSNSVSANSVAMGGQPSNGAGIRINTTSSNAQISVSSNVSMSSVVSGPGFLTTSSVVGSQQSFDLTTAAVSIQTNYNTVTSNTILTSVSQSVDSYSLVPPNMLTDKSNPLTDIIEAKQNVPQNTATKMTGPIVNKNAQDNDVAGGVSINKMSTAPIGYGDYLNFTMRDVAFYTPKEVYKNQRNVDNQRALRLLTNDSKHKEMVELQYAK